jgi:hypothetical protein
VVADPERLPTVEEALDADEADTTVDTRWVWAVYDEEHRQAVLTGRVYEGPRPPEMRS